MDAETYRQGLTELAVRDRDLARTLDTWGDPPFWTQAPGFPGLVMSILAQQVSFESAQAAFAKLETVVDEVNPDLFLALDDRTLKAAGFSRQKAAYTRGVAHAIVGGDLDLHALASMDNGHVRQRLVQLKGIGRWTADAYLLFSLRRADAWPSGDLALIKAIQELRGLPALTSQEADVAAEDWRPWRAVAARMLWHHYLCTRGRMIRTTNQV